MASRREIGEALDNLVEDVKRDTLDLVRQYRGAAAPVMLLDQQRIPLLKQAIDTPHRARARIGAWVADYNARNRSGAVAFLNSCLVAAGSQATVASIDAAIAAIEAQALAVVNAVRAGTWDWDRAAAEVEAALTVQVRERFDYMSLEIPKGYTTVWGEPW